MKKFDKHALLILNFCTIDKKFQRVWYITFYTGRMGSQVVVPYRGDEYYCKHLKVMGDLGQIHLRVNNNYILQ